MQINVSDSVWSKVKGIAFVLVGVVAALAFTGHIHVPHFPIPAPTPAPTPKPDPKPEPEVKPDWFGLKYNADRHRELVASMPKLAKAAPGLMKATDAKDKRPILLYKAWTTLFKDYPPYRPQEIGDCVSFGHAHAGDLLQCIEWVLEHDGKKRPTPADIQELDTEFIYGASREIGGMLGPFDGSYGSAAVKAMQQMGMVSRRMMGDEGQYSGRRAKQFGRTGPPADWKAKASTFRLGNAAQVTTWDELVAALHSGHPVTICTGAGFTMTRDSDGFCSRRGRWGHCMFVAGVRFDKEGACIVQSWGVNTPGGPTALEQPTYSFWVSRRDIEGILGEGDSWALSGGPHFGLTPKSRKARTLPAEWRKAA